MSVKYGTLFVARDRFPSGFGTWDSGRVQEAFRWGAGDLEYNLMVAYLNAKSGWCVKVIGTDRSELVLTQRRNWQEEVVRVGKDLRGGLVKGSTDPLLPGRLLVPSDRPHYTFPKLGKVPPSTFYRYDVKGRRLEALVTVLPATGSSEGVAVAWDTCGRCLSHIRSCGCRDITPPRSVVVIYEHVTGEVFEKPEYREEKRTFAPIRERGKPLPSKTREAAVPVPKATPASMPKSLPKLRKTQPLDVEPVKVAKSLPSRRREEERNSKLNKKIEVTEGFDLSGLDETAETAGQDALDRLRRSLRKASKK